MQNQTGENCWLCLKNVTINPWNAPQKWQTEDRRSAPAQTTPAPQCLETSLWGSGDAVQSGVVNQNESRDLGNTNTNIVLPNTTALTSLIKTQDLPSHASTADRRVEYVRQLRFVTHMNMCMWSSQSSRVHLLQGFAAVKAKDFCGAIILKWLSSQTHKHKLDVMERSVCARSYLAACLAWVWICVRARSCTRPSPFLCQPPWFAASSKLVCSQRHKERRLTHRTWMLCPAPGGHQASPSHFNCGWHCLKTRREKATHRFYWEAHTHYLKRFLRYRNFSQ